MAATVNSREEQFCKEYVLNGNNSVAAWRVINPNSKAKPESQAVSASRMLAKANIQLRIKELQGMASEQSEKDFGVSVEWRLEMLKKIADAGMAEWHDQNGNVRRENLAAARGAIQTINDMLGVALPGEKGKRKSFSVNLRIEDASAEVSNDEED